MSTPKHSDDLAFPSLADAYVGAAAIGVAGVYTGRRLTLRERVITGSWRHADGTRSYQYSRWVEYERSVCGVPMSGRALVPEGVYMVIALTVRKDVAA